MERVREREMESVREGREKVRESEAVEFPYSFHPGTCLIHYIY